MPSKTNQEMLKKWAVVLKDYDQFFITENKGLAVSDLTDLRVRLREQGAVYKIVKNNVFRIALENQQIKNLDNDLIGMNGVLFLKDPIKAAKALDSFMKEKKDKIGIKSGYIDGAVVSEEHIKTLASLLSKEELISKMLFVMQSPVKKLAFVLSEIAQVKSDEN